MRNIKNCFGKWFVKLFTNLFSDFVYKNNSLKKERELLRNPKINLLCVYILKWWYLFYCSANTKIKRIVFAFC